MIRKLAIVLVATLLLGPACTSQKDVSAADAGRRADIYAVYSEMFANPDPGDRVYLIDAKTHPYSWIRHQRLLF
jgi:hypothetical protein